MSKVSVIVPVYNVEQYIEECARSLFEQTLDDIEYIFIDDCSTDRSIEMLSRVLKGYPHRKMQVVIHRMKQNSGQAAVRKWGVLHATGDYVIHCDSDDSVEKDMYRYMYNSAIQNKADIVICDFSLSDGGRERCVAPKVKSEENYRTGIFTKDVHCSTVNKLIRRELYDNPIIFPKENYAEDLALTSQLFYYARKFVYCPVAFYHYRYNPASISKQRGIEAILRSFRQTCANAALVERFFQDKPIGKRMKWAIDCMKSFERDRLIVLTDKREYYRMWKNTFPELNKTILFNPLMSWKNKLRFILVMWRVYPLYAKYRGLVPKFNVA